MGKGQIARYEQFLLFPLCFQKAYFPGASKGVIVWEWVNSLPNENFLDLSKLKAFADTNTNVTGKLKICLWKSRKHCGKRRKCWLPAFSPFHIWFSEGFSFQGR